MKNIPFKEYNSENEQKIYQFWKDKEIIDKINKKNENGPKFYFLQGPPYTSGKIHCGQAWNHALKDAILRYKRMRGYNVLSRAGYDMHGLPTAQKVQKKLSLENKDDIEKYGKDNFVNECIKWSEEKAADMSKDLDELGVTLDFSDPYKPITQEYIDSVWYLIKKAYDKERLYLGEKTMSWCAHCQTALAKHEQEYKEIKDNSIFLKFRKKGKENEYFLIWTTTPWTIPFNLAIMVNPEMEYVDAEVTLEDGKKEIWTLCKDLSGIFLNNIENIQYKIIKEYKGSEIEGQEYEHPWEHLNKEIQEMKKEHPKIFTVILSTEYVDSSAGTGMVHCAPGCGPEDYQIGIANNIPPYNDLDESGIFPGTVEKFKGMKAKKDDSVFIKMMKEDGFLIKTSPVEHDYAHCERCHEPVVFRTTKQWFFKVEDLKEKMLSFNKEVNWHPETAKNAFNSWLDNLKDNSITKQRIWGTPAPIWVHEDEEGNVDEVKVIGSKEELQSLSSKKLPENLHKPWIDEIEIKSPETGKTLKRIPDVLDVWIDAGCASWASLYYPSRKDLFEKYFPADFIVEGKDQIRGWFNLLMVAGILALDKPVFRNVNMHGFISDVDGVKMSKSLGNIISPEEVISKTSKDNFRYYFISTKAGEDIAFSWEQLNLYQRQLKILWNTSRYLYELIDMSEEELSLNEMIKKGKENLSTEEKYIISKTNTIIKEVTELFEKNKIDEVPYKITDLILSLSRNYIQSIREKSNSTLEERSAIIYTLRYSLFNLIKIFTPISPFICEEIYQNLKTYDETLEKNSINEYGWPSSDESLIDEDMVKNFEKSMEVVSGILAAREKAGINIRQPLNKAIIVDEGTNLFKNMIKTQSNIKNLDIVEDFDKIIYKAKANFRELGRDFGQETGELGQKLNSLSPEQSKLIKKSLDDNGEYSFEDKKIKPRHLEFDIDVEKPYYLSKIPGMMIAIDSTLDENLLNEGLSREFIRRVQNARKELDMVKTQMVDMEMDNKELLEKIKPWIENIKKVCGLNEIKINENIEGQELEFKGEKVKIKFI
ncbi:MAG: isoleucine--tRNA ligase [Nanobdellota archaeon]